MLHHAHEEHQQPFTANDLDSALEQARRFEQAKREQRREHCRGLSPDELRQEIRTAAEVMHANIDAGHYLEAKERRNAAVHALSEMQLPVRERNRDRGLEFGF